MCFALFVAIYNIYLLAKTTMDVLQHVLTARRRQRKPDPGRDHVMLAQLALTSFPDLRECVSVFVSVCV